MATYKQQASSEAIPLTQNAKRITQKGMTTSKSLDMVLADHQHQMRR